MASCALGEEKIVLPLLSLNAFSLSTSSATYAPMMVMAVELALGPPRKA
ncbi:hypothetical protein J3D46_003004 [Paenarthrobacter sp. A20]|nr:hypothetical protein [Paenarthrobacter sp. A20]